jgi:NADH dehydrogenase
MHRVVIIGGGFGGLYLAKALRRAAVGATLIDRCNYHLFQPLLYQVATGGLSPANIAAPLRAVLRRYQNARVLMAEARGFDLVGRRVLLDDGEIGYDTLVVAAGAVNSYFGHDQWAQFAPGLKTVEDATEIRRRAFLAFEAAERATDAEEVHRWLRFVVVGGGPTGVELAGALAEIARDTLRDQFRSFDPAKADITLLEGADRVLPPYPPELSASAQRQLEQLGVKVITGAMVANIGPDTVTYRRDDNEETIVARTILWGAGVKGSPLGAELAHAAGVELDRSGRVPVEPDLTVAGHPEVFVIGDLALALDGEGKPLPGIAPVAIQQGKHVAKTIRARLAGKAIAPFKYSDYGTMATIGRHRAVAVMGPLRFSGYFAWMAWLFVHLMYIVQFQNRVLVLVQWAWNYVTWNRAARLITGGSQVAKRTADDTRTD